MKRFMIAAAALSLAAPAFADQPTTLLEVRKHFAASEDGADGYVFEDGTSGITRAGAEQLARIAAEDETGVDVTADQLLSQDMAIVNDRAARIFERIAAEQDEMGS
jgi:hypothetical protein